MQTQEKPKAKPVPYLKNWLIEYVRYSGILKRVDPYPGQDLWQLQIEKFNQTHIVIVRAT